MGYDFFVSYSTQDKLFVDALVHRLEESGYRCWYAPRDIAAGVSWPAAIAEAIRESPVMLLVFSDSSNKSEEISRELTLASNNKCIVIPVRIDNVPPSPELAYHLSNRHWLDVYDLEAEAAIDRIEEGLKQYLERAAGGGTVEGTSGRPLPGAFPPAKKKSRPSWKVLALAAVLLCLVGGTSLYYLSLPEKDSTAHLLQPAQGIGMYRYMALQANPAMVYLQRLAPIAEGPRPEEWLFAVTGTGSRLDGRIFRCRIEMGTKARYFTTIEGKQHVIFEVDQQNRGTVFLPDRESAFIGTTRDHDPETGKRFVEAYRDRKKWQPAK